MSYNIKPDRHFALVLASVKNISSLVNEAMREEFIHVALEFLEEETKALRDGIAILKTIDEEKYHETFSDMLPAKINDIKYAIDFCNSMLIKGNFKIAQGEQEYNFKKKRSDLKIRNLEELKTVSISLEDWDFVDYLAGLIREEESKKYQA